MKKSTLLFWGLLVISVSTCFAQDLETFSINKLDQKDTLVLFTVYPDCGEFGGHNEIVKIFREETLRYLYTKDTVTCEADDPNKFRKLKFSRKEQLSNVDIKLIEDYTHAVYKKSKGENYGCSNAFRVFWIECKGQHFEFPDSCTDWDEFTPLVRRLLK